MFDAVNAMSPTARIRANGNAEFSDVQSTSQNGGQLAGFRNRIINGDMRVWQRSLGPGNPQTGSNRIYLTADRYFKFNIGDTNQRIDTSSDNFGGVIGRFPYANSMTGTQAGRIIGQCIEGPLPSGEVTFSVWVRLSEQPTNLYMTTNRNALSGLNDFSGFYGGNGSGSPEYVNPDGWPGIYPGNNIWFKIQRTFTPASPELGIGVALQPVFSASTTATIDSTGWQLEAGSVATPFEHRPIGTELALCQRYYQYYGTVQLPGTEAYANRWEYPIQPIMRVEDPDVVVFNIGNGTLDSALCRKNRLQIRYTGGIAGSEFYFSCALNIDAEL